MGADDTNELWTEGKIIDEMRVHHIQMEPISACLLCTNYLLGHARPIGGEKRGGDDSALAVGHVRPLSSRFALLQVLLPDSRIMDDSVGEESFDDLPIQFTTDNFLMEQALRQARRAMQAGEVPVGAVIIHDGEIIARAHNQVETLRDATAHAEMLALSQAQESFGDWRLTDCDLYVTKEPCPMCAGAIVHCRIRRVIFGVGDPKGGAAGGLLNLLQQPTLNHRCEISAGILQDESLSLLRSFFRNARLAKKIGENCENETMNGGAFS